MGMSAHWVLTDKGLSLTIERQEFEQEIFRAVEWQIEFDCRVAEYKTRYAAFPRWRKFIYRRFSVGLGWEARGYTKRKILTEASNGGER